MLAASVLAPQTTAEESLFHDWEGVCLGCAITRQYDPALAACPVRPAVGFVRLEIALQPYAALAAVAAIGDRAATRAVHALCSVRTHRWCARAAE